MTSYNVSLSAVSIPSNSGGATLTINESTSGTGSVTSSDTFSLHSGVKSYTTSDVFAGNGSVQAKFDIGPPSSITTTSSCTVPLSITTSGQAFSVGLVEIEVARKK